MSKSFNKTIEYISSGIATLLYMLDDETKSKTTEIRLRVNKPLCITYMNKSFFISVDGKIGSVVPSNPFLPSKSIMQECYMMICNNSVYAHEQELSQGFVTLEHGARVGVFGEAIYDAGRITAYKNITSLNYRIPREILGYANSIIEVLRIANGIIICGPPSSSKTTLLRDAIRLLSSCECGYKRVTVVDARNEISAVHNGKIGMNLGVVSDVLNISSTELGIEMAIRVMNPEYIAVDEIVSNDELNALLKAAKCGVKLISTLHIGSVDEIHSKKNIKILLENEAIDYAVFINHPNAQPKIIKLN